MKTNPETHPDHGPDSAAERGASPAQLARIQGFEETDAGANASAVWQPFSERRVRVAIVGEGVCSFGSQFGYQTHPNAEVVAVSDLDPALCRALQERTRAKKAYPTFEELLKHTEEDRVEAVYIATDAPSHVRLAIMALEHGLHVASAVPAFFGADQLEMVPKLVDAVKASGKLYMMNETTAFRPEGYAMRKLYEAGMLGDVVYTEGEYYHPDGNDLDSVMCGSFGKWREGCPPQYYPTHSNAFYTCVTHKRFVEVACSGVPSLKTHYKPENNRYANPYGSEFAMMRCEDGSTARMLVAWDVPAYGGEIGRIFGNKGCYVPEKGGYRGWFDAEVAKMDLAKPPLPPGVDAGGHGGSHSYLTDDFLRGILVPGHKVCVDLRTALDTTLAGVYAHLSAMKGGETLKIPAAW